MNLDPKTWWYLTRATGFVSWALLAVAVLWGLFITNKTLNRSTAPAWVLDLHRHLGGLAVVFVAVHVGALALDGYTHWGWADLFVPMASTWHPGAIAWGIVGFYLLIAIEVTSLLGRRFPKRWWRRVHMLSFPLYVVASVHLFAAGTDSANVVVTWMVVTVSTLIAFLTVVRALAAAKPRETRPNPRIAVARAQALTADRPETVPQRNGTAPPAPTSEPVPVHAPVPASEPTTGFEPAPATADLLPSSARPARPPPVSAVPLRPSLATRLGAPTLAQRVARLQTQTAAAVRHARPASSPATATATATATASGDRAARP